MDHGRKPLARTTDLIIEELGDELLVYDEDSDRGHCLSPTAAAVWRRCDGRTPVEGLSAQLDFDAATVCQALDELTGSGLLEAAPVANGGTTRRELTVRLAKAGGAVAAAPLIVSIVAPTPAAAVSPPPGCSGIGGCETNCGQATGCKAVTIGCICCQLPGLTCEDDGVQRDNNVKLCVAGDVCPPNLINDTTSCLGPPCPNPRLGQERSSEPTSSATTAESPGASSGSAPSPSSPTPTTPTTPTTPAPSGPAAPPEAAPAPSPTVPVEPTPAPTPVPDPAPTPPAPTTTTP